MWCVVRYHNVYCVSIMRVTCSACSDWLWSGFSAVQPPDATGRVRSFSSARRWASLRPLTAARTDLKNTHRRRYSTDCISINSWFTCMCIVFQQDQSYWAAIKTCSTAVGPVVWERRERPASNPVSFTPEPHYTALLTSRSTHNMHKHSWHQRYS